jgi:hypothetical protein
VAGPLVRRPARRHPALDISAPGVGLCLETGADRKHPVSAALRAGRGPLPLSVCGGVACQSARRGGSASARRVGSAAGGRAVHAGRRGGAGSEPVGADQLTAEFAAAVGAGRAPSGGPVEVSQASTGPGQQRRQLGAFEGDGCALGSCSSSAFARTDDWIRRSRSSVRDAIRSAAFAFSVASSRASASSSTTVPACTGKPDQRPPLSLSWLCWSRREAGRTRMSPGCLPVATAWPAGVAASCRRRTSRRRRRAPDR